MERPFTVIDVGKIGLRATEDHGIAPDARAD